MIVGCKALDALATIEQSPLVMLHMSIFFLNGEGEKKQIMPTGTKG